MFFPPGNRLRCTLMDDHSLDLTDSGNVITTRDHHEFKNYLGSFITRECVVYSFFCLVPPQNQLLRVEAWKHSLHSFTHFFFLIFFSFPLVFFLSFYLRTLPLASGFLDVSYSCKLTLNYTREAEKHNESFPLIPRKWTFTVTVPKRKSGGWAFLTTGFRKQKY